MASAGLTYDSQNAPLQSGLKEAKQAQSRPNGGAPNGAGGLFGPDFIAKLHMNPQTRHLLSQPDFMAMLKDLGNNPSNMSSYLQDKRLQQALSVGLGINMMSGDDFKKGDTPMPPQSAAAAQATQDGTVESDNDDDMPVCTQAHKHISAWEHDCIQLSCETCSLVLKMLLSRLMP